MQAGSRQFDLRFWDHGHGKFDIEAVLECTVVAGPPHKWAAWPAETDGNALMVDEAGVWSVAAGAPFKVCLELEDEFGNRCVLMDVLTFPARRTSNTSHLTH